MSETEDDRIARLSRLASGGIYEMAKTVRALPSVGDLDDADVRLAIACSCLRVAASEIAAIPVADISPFLEFLKKQFVVLRRLDAGGVVGAHGERLQ
jgi:hypothetical protein